MPTKEHGKGSTSQEKFVEKNEAKFRRGEARKRLKESQTM